MLGGWVLTFWDRTYKELPNLLDIAYLVRVSYDP
jgi:hypothetical protein